MKLLKKLLRTASRTFAIGIEQLPSVLCDAGTVAYLLLRVSDYLEDNEEMSNERKITLLNLWVQILKGNAGSEELTSQIQNANTSNPDAVVALHTADIMEQLASIRAVPIGWPSACFAMKSRPATRSRTPS
jgi:phytoene/squalene synthetase